MSPVPAAGTEVTPQLLLCWRRPRGCLPRSEQILRSIQLLKESFCSYSAFPCVCGAAPSSPPPLTPSQTRGWVSPRGCSRRRAPPPPQLSSHQCRSRIFTPRQHNQSGSFGGSFITFYRVLKDRFVPVVVGAGRFTAGFIPVASRPSSAPEQERVRCN